MKTKKWAALGLAVTATLGITACSDSNNDDQDINLPIPGNAQAYLLTKEGTAFEIERLSNSGTGNESGPDQVITGLPAGEDIVGMDFRPRDGKLYLVGRNGSTAQSLGAVYVINDLPTSGNLTATLVSDLVAAPDDTLPFTGFTNGTSFGVDFNPQANALRIVSSSGENLRIPFGGAGAIPAQLTVITDTLLNAGGATKTGIIAAAYTNNADLVASTSLLVLSSNELFGQAPPNDGILTSRGTLSLDGAAIDPAATGLSFDILTAGGVDTGFFYGQAGDSDSASFGTVNLTTGALTVLNTDDVDGDESPVGLAMKAAAL